MDETQKTPEMNDQASQEIAACKDQLLRVTADFQNFRKRTEKERIDWGVMAQASVINKLLPVVEDLDRALSASAETGQAGLVLVHKNLKKALAELGVEEIPCSGAFDPSVHEALTQVDKSDVSSGSIVEVYAPGYTFKGTVLRHAKVAVAK